MSRIKEWDPVDELKEAYDLLNEVIRNPYKIGYIVVVTKVKPRSEEPIELELLDFKSEIIREINYITRRILRKIKFDKLPNGIKK